MGRIAYTRVGSDLDEDDHFGCASETLRRRNLWTTGFIVISVPLVYFVFRFLL